MKTLHSAMKIFRGIARKNLLPGDLCDRANNEALGFARLPGPRRYTRWPKTVPYFAVDRAAPELPPPLRVVLCAPVDGLFLGLNHGPYTA